MRGRSLTSVLAALGAGICLALTACPASAAHSTFPAGSPFSGGTDFATNLPTFFTIGPVGLLSDGSHFFVTDFANSNTYRFPSAGGSALSPEVQAANGLSNGITRSNGHYFGLNASGLYAFDPGTLAVGALLTAVPGTAIRAVAGDPLTTDLYVSTNSGLYRVQSPDSGAVVTTFVSGDFDGLTFTSDGSVLYATRVTDQHVVGYSRTGTVGFDVSLAGHGPDGIAIALSGAIATGVNVSGNLFVNSNDGTIERIDTNNGNAVSVAASGGSRGDLATVGPDNCLYVTQTNVIEKLAPCFFQPQAGISPTQPASPAPSPVPSPALPKTGVGGSSPGQVGWGLLAGLALLATAALYWRRSQEAAS